VEALEEMASHVRVRRDVQVRARIEHVGVDVVLWDQDGPAGEPHPSTCAGCTISPATAAAAATHAFARQTSDSPEPIRPRKLRFVVVTARSPAARTPMPPPKQAPHVGVETIAPASTNTSSSPSAIASR